MISLPAATRNVNVSPYVKSLPPHIHSGISVVQIQWKIFACLVPFWIVAIVFFGWNGLRIPVLSFIGMLGSEALFCLGFKKKQRIYDGTVFGLALVYALLLPANTPSAFVLLGAGVGSVVGREIFGGLGAHPFHPAAAGIAFLSLSFPHLFDLSSGSLVDSGLVGYILFLIVAGYLFSQKILHWEVPVLFLATLLSVRLLAPQHFGAPMISGATFMAAFYLISDSGTTPMTRFGKRLSAIGFALAVLFLERFTQTAVSLAFASLMMSILAPWLDEISKPLKR